MESKGIERNPIENTANKRQHYCRIALYLELSLSSAVPVNMEESFIK